LRGTLCGRVQGFAQIICERDILLELVSQKKDIKGEYKSLESEKKKRTSPSLYAQK
jgi:hypothetical protein